ncbi:MAG: ATP-binding protein [Candidatus Limnocylindria bacterium]
MVGAKDARPAAGRGRGTPLSVYLVGLLILFALTAAGTTLFVREQATQDAERTAHQETIFAAGLASTEIAAALAQLDSTVARTAATPGIAGVFTPGAPCNVAFGAVGVFQKTRLDFVTAGGIPTCSSALPVPAGLIYAASAWFPEARRAPYFTAPIVDPRADRPSAVSSAPVADRGAVMIFVDLTELGITLATRFAGPRKLEFVVTSADGKTALARSSDAERWAGVSIEDTAFARATGSSRLDLDNVPRVYGEATVGVRGWKVYAGADRAAVLSAADDLFVRGLAVSGIGLLVLFVGTLFVHRRIVGPIHDLSRGVTSVVDPDTARPIVVRGPAEITGLAEDFNGLIGTLQIQRAEQRRAEERLRQSERLEGIGRLAGGIAHDFNNILAVVMNYSQFVEDTLPADSEVRDDVVQIRLAAERGATFTRQLLTFAHRGAVNPQDVQLNTVLSELRTMLRRTIPERVTIELRPAPDLWTVRIDIGQLEQLVLNLVVNAADAMPDGGTVLLETANVELDGQTPTASGVSPGRYVRLDVTDTGYGMPKDVLARAFEPFFTTKPKGKGTGLGLATGYGIVQQAEGTISIDSVVGQGTTVRVHLPAQVGVQAEPARIRASSMPEATPSKALIMVVEDEAPVRAAVMRILSDRGYGTIQAAAPASAVEVARLWSGPIDLLVTDIVMPEMSGDELARELRKARPQLRVVYITGYSGELDMTTLRVDGPVVQKPFTRDSLLAAVEGAFAEKN